MLEGPPGANAIAADVVDCVGLVRKELGVGLYERLYRVCLAEELRSRGHLVEQEVPVEASFRGRPLGVGYRADLIVGRKVLVETKACASLLPTHEAQTLTYLRLTGLPIALLVNFNAVPLRDGIRRFLGPNA